MQYFVACIFVSLTGELLNVFSPDLTTRLPQLITYIK